ncbi:MAG: class I SAM-dependent methyltransferase [Bacteroidota bacterium]
MSKEWFENWFDSPYYHILYKNRDDREAKAFIDALLRHLGPSAQANILDLACGKGRFSRHLAQKGFDVTGLDLSSNSIDYARRYEQENLSFFQHDMRRPFRTNYFDYIFSFFTSFGYFDTDEEHLQTLQAIRQGLRPNGVLVLDFFNSTYVKNQLLGEEEKVLDGIRFKIKKWVDDTSVFKTIQFEDQGTAYTFTEQVRLFSLDDFRQLFRVASIEIVGTFGNYQLAPFRQQESPRLILVGKPYDRTTTT